MKDTDSEIITKKSIEGHDWDGDYDWTRFNKLFEFRLKGF
jgi:hypothetical protein